MRRFGTEGPVSPEKNYIVSRTAELADFIDRVKQGKYLVIFAPRQTGKTTFFQFALDALVAEDPSYFPIPLNFETYEGCTPSEFYQEFSEDIREEVETVFHGRGEVAPAAVAQFLEDARITDHISVRRFFRQLARLLIDKRVVFIIDEFDGIPREAVKGFLHSLRHIYLSRGVPRCPYSLGIVGVKSITQLDYDRSISPFNIQDEFHLPNFTLEQVHELLAQYTQEVGQAFMPEVIESLHKQTAGQPVLVNWLAHILTKEMDIPKTETITMDHWTVAHTRLLRSRNTNISHLTTNIRKDRRFEKILMRITAQDDGVPFNLHDAIIDALVTYGVISEGADGFCDIANPIYLYAILQAFKPTVNGLEDEYFPEDTRAGFKGYLTETGELAMERLLNNFRDFIARAGFRILQVPDTPQEFVGQYLLFTYLDQFVRLVDAHIYLEVQTGRGRMDLIILHNGNKYIVETKIWEGDLLYEAGKQQLAAYLTLEGADEGYYIVFDHRRNPEARAETETRNEVNNSELCHSSRARTPFICSPDF